METFAPIVKLVAVNCCCKDHLVRCVQISRVQKVRCQKVVVAVLWTKRKRFIIKSNDYILTVNLFRQVLSRAFRNRFVELHFDEIPSKELEEILQKRCHLPKSYSQKFVKVMLDLQVWLIFFVLEIIWKRKQLTSWIN